MALLDDIVEVLYLADGELNGSSAVDIINSAFVGATLVHRNLFRNAIVAHRLVDEAFCSCHVSVGRQREVDGLPFLVNSAVEILPDVLDFDVRLVHSPAGPDHALMLARELFDERRKANRLAVDR